MKKHLTTKEMRQPYSKEEVSTYKYFLQCLRDYDSMTKRLEEDDMPSYLADALKQRIRYVDEVMDYINNTFDSFQVAAATLYLKGRYEDISVFTHYSKRSAVGLSKFMVNAATHNVQVQS